MIKRNYIALTTLKGLSSKHLALTLERFAPIEDLFNLTYAQKIELGIPAPLVDTFNTIDWKNVDDICDWEQRGSHHHLLTLIDPSYPSILKEITDPPPLLYAKGNLDALKPSALAVIGSRRASIHGLSNAYNFSKDLARKGLTIISGLADGIDSKAHQGALEAQGLTIAVMGTGIDNVYPYRNTSLAKSIENTGLLLTEFPLGAAPKPYHFPRRNRIISGLSLGVIVIEASLKSGSLITARLGLEQGREIFALPSSLDNPTAKGCHYLIKEGAKLIENINDIIEEFPDQLSLRHRSTEEKLTKKLELKTNSLVKFVGYELTPINTIMLSSGLSPQIVNSQLVDLELKGLIKSALGGYMRLPQ